MLRTISLKDTDLNSDIFKEASDALRDDGLVCLPCGGSYRIVADLGSPTAVVKLFSSKRRTKHTPTLVFVADRAMLRRITSSIDDVRRRLIDAYWPGPLTVLVDPELELPRKLVKKMVRANGKVGVRIPASDIAVGIVRAFDGPLLVSSANIYGKKGAYSAAQVRKNFFNLVDLFFDDGDLQACAHSTVIDVVDGQAEVIREGSIREEEIRLTAAP